LNGLLPFGLNSVLPVAGLGGGIAPGIIGRRRRSLGLSERMSSLVTQFDSALTKFSQQRQ